MTPKLTKFVPFIFVGLWSTGFIGAKYAMPYAEPFTFLSIRTVLTLVILLLILVFTARQILRGNEKRQMIIGALVHGVYLGGVFWAISRGFPAGMSALIVSLQPLLTSILASLMGLQTLGKREWAGLVLGLIGVTLVIYGRYGWQSEALNLASLLAVTLSLFGISVGTVLQKRWGDGQRILYGNFWQYIGALLLFLPLSFATETREITWSEPLILALLWLVFALSIGATGLLMFMIREGEVAKVASYFYLVPPLVLLEAWILFDERLSTLSLFGAGLVILSVYLVVRRPPLLARSK